MTTQNLKLRIGGVPEHFNLPWKLCIESGDLKNLDIDASWTDFYSGTGAMVQALNNDEVDVATLLTEGAVAAIENTDAEFELFSFYTKTPLIWGIHTPTKTQIQSLDDLQKATFAISRYGSGSHLMAFLLAESVGLDTHNLKFEIINNLDGARELFSEDKNKGNYVFLWEKFMTKPYVDQGEMRRLGDFPTPWSCFVTCVRKSVLKNHKSQVSEMMQRVLDTAKKLKSSSLLDRLIAREYKLDIKDVQTWLKTIEWNSSVKLKKKTIANVKTKLKQLDII